MFFGLALQSAGCGPSFVAGPLLMPPAISAEAADDLAQQTPSPDDNLPVCRPAAIRVYPSGELVVDVLVVASASSSASLARFHTNGLNVPAKLTTSGSEGDSIVIRTQQGKCVRPVRAVLGHPPFEQNRANLYASDGLTDNVRDVVIVRGGKSYEVFFVPVLLAADNAVSLGDRVQIRIEPRGGSKYDIDDRWYGLTVEPFIEPSLH